MEKHKRSLLIAFIIVIVMILVLSVIGIFSLKSHEIILQGQIEANEITVSGMLPGRVEQVFVQQGQPINQGDTLVHIVSKEVQAQYAQLKAMEMIAVEQNKKLDAGTRSQLIEIAEQLWNKGKADLQLAETTMKRINVLYEQGVVSTQRKDEVVALYQSAVAEERAAYYEYQMALQGAQKEDRSSSEASVQAAKSAADVVSSLLGDSYLTAAASGEISSVELKVGELASIGTPIMSIVVLEDAYMVLNVREDLMPHFRMNQEISVEIPALGIKNVPFTIYYISPLGSFATWKSTKQSGSYDLRTFQIRALPNHPVEGLRPGMSVLLSINE